MSETRGVSARLIGHVPQVGAVTWLGVRPARGEPMAVRDAVSFVAGRGVAGDRYRTAGGKRQVSLIQHEHLDVLARLLRREAVDPALLRRNVVVSGINLRALAKRRFRVGDALLEGVDLCHPCSKMEDALGDGGYAVMRGHGGILARVLEGADVGLGAEVRAELE